MYLCTEYDSPFGKLTLASNGEAICGLWMEGQKYFGGSIANEIKRDDSVSAFADLRDWLDSYFDRSPLPIDAVSLEPVGSEFRQAVWRKLKEIPYGELATYGSIAEEVKRERGKASALAVGGAVGHNPISIIIPCHRVVGADGSLTGFGGGLDRKIWLLEHEGVDMSKLYRPKRGTAL